MASSRASDKAHVSAAREPRTILPMRFDCQFNGEHILFQQQRKTKEPP